jgi:hypothetical protein
MQEVATIWWIQLSTQRAVRTGISFTRCRRQALQLTGIQLRPISRCHKGTKISIRSNTIRGIVYKYRTNIVLQGLQAMPIPRRECLSTRRNSRQPREPQRLSINSSRCLIWVLMSSNSNRQQLGSLRVRSLRSMRSNSRTLVSTHLQLSQIER